MYVHSYKNYLIPSLSCIKIITVKFSPKYIPSGSSCVVVIVRLSISFSSLTLSSIIVTLNRTMVFPAGIVTLYDPEL